MLLIKAVSDVQCNRRKLGAIPLQGDVETIRVGYLVRRQHSTR